MDHLEAPRHHRRISRNRPLLLGAGLVLVVIVLAVFSGFGAGPRSTTASRGSTTLGGSDPSGSQFGTSTSGGKGPSSGSSADTVAGDNGPTGGTAAYVMDFGGTQYPLDPYISRTFVDQLNYGRTSFRIQSWRGYLETVPATQFLAGIGLNYNPPNGVDNDALIHDLASVGVRSLRIEVGWDKIDLSESAVTEPTATRLRTIFTACRKYGISPLILFNANDGGPEPLAPMTRVVASNAPAGSRTVALDSVDGLVVGHSGLSQINKATTGVLPIAGLLFTAIDSASKTVTLSKPLPTPLSQGQSVRVDTLKHLPLYPVGTPEFDDTAAAWTHYVDLVTNLASASGIADLETEIWNELSFGSDFIWIDNYYDPQPFAKPPNGLFREGGPAWELARRTSDFLHGKYGGHVRVIWGFSNTTFLGTAVTDLPPGIDGQSYHPYKTKPLLIPQDFPTANQAKLFIDSYPLGFTLAVPESTEGLSLKPESITAHLLPPWIRESQKPSGTQTFYHYITEHGVAPRLAQINDPNTAEMYKAKTMLRNYAFWLNKGIAKLDIFAVYDKQDGGFGMLDDRIDPAAYGSQPLDAVLSPQLRALRNLVSVFNGATPSVSPRQLDVGVAAVGQQFQVFPDNKDPLWYRDLFTFLPFQVNDHRFVIATYMLTYNWTRPLPAPAMGFRVQVKNVAGDRAKVSFYDPMAGQTIPAPILSHDQTSVTIGVSDVDYPRLIVVDDG